VKTNNLFHSNQNEILIAVPKSYLDGLMENQKEILTILKSNDLSNPKSIGDYIPEEKAQKILDKKTTWFWEMRTRGKLAFSKVGNKNYYSMKDIEGLLNANKKEKFTSLKHN
jgi:hypothetical protein